MNYRYLAKCATNWEKSFYFLIIHSFSYFALLLTKINLSTLHDYTLLKEDKNLKKLHNCNLIYRRKRIQKNTVKTKQRTDILLWKPRNFCIKSNVLRITLHLDTVKLITINKNHWAASSILFGKGYGTCTSNN